MLALFGEASGGFALEKIKTRMQNDEEGRKILQLVITQKLFSF